MTAEVAYHYVFRTVGVVSVFYFTVKEFNCADELVEIRRR